MAIIQRLVDEGVEAASHQAVGRPKISKLPSFSDLEDSLNHVDSAIKLLESDVAFHHKLSAWATYHGTEVAAGAFTKEVKTARAEAAKIPPLSDIPALLDDTPPSNLHLFEEREDLKEEIRHMHDRGEFKVGSFRHNIKGKGSTGSSFRGLQGAFIPEVPSEAKV